MSLLKKFTDDFDEKRGSLEKVELDELDGTTVYVYARLSLDEWQKITSPDDPFEKAVVGVMTVCRDSEGVLCFTEKAKQALMTKVDSAVMIRTWVQVQSKLQAPSFEAAAKN